MSEEPRMTDSELVQKIKEDSVYKQILKDSFGGVMYNVANIGKYEADEILALWENVEHKSSQDGIIKGVFNFLKEKQW
jgi:hypothetical protein